MAGLLNVVGPGKAFLIDGPVSPSGRLVHSLKVSFAKTANNGKDERMKKMTRQTTKNVVFADVFFVRLTTLTVHPYSPLTSPLSVVADV